MTALLTRQFEFGKMLPQLLQFILSSGYQYTLGDAYRDYRCTYGHPKSLHRRRLAIDINLFKDGVLLQDTESHLPIGEFWESLGGTWGGRFKDGNHYSLEFDGMR